MRTYPLTTERILAMVAEIVLAGFVSFPMLFERSRYDSDKIGWLGVLLALPFLVALFLQMFRPDSGAWNGLYAFHQAGLIFWGSLAVLFSVVAFVPGTEGWGELWRAVVFCFGVASLQWWVLYVARRFAGAGRTTAWKPASMVRVFTILYFAVVALMLK